MVTPRLTPLRLYQTTDAEEGKWVTIHGAHIMVSGSGQVLHGPAALKGKKLNKKDYNEEPEFGPSKPEHYNQPSQYTEGEQKAFNYHTTAANNNISQSIRRNEPRTSTGELSSQKLSAKLQAAWQPHQIAELSSEEQQEKKRHSDVAYFGEKIRSVLSRSHSTHNVTLHRGENKLDSERLKALKNLKPGGVYQSTGISSTSEDPEIVKNFVGGKANSVIYHIEAPAGTKALHLNKSNLNSSLFKEQTKAENEVLLDHNQKYTVTKHLKPEESPSGYREITMRAHPHNWEGTTGDRRYIN